MSCLLPWLKLAILMLESVLGRTADCMLAASAQCNCFVMGCSTRGCQLDGLLVACGTLCSFLSCVFCSQFHLLVLNASYSCRMSCASNSGELHIQRCAGIVHSLCPFQRSTDGNGERFHSDRWLYTP